MQPQLVRVKRKRGDEPLYALVLDSTAARPADDAHENNDVNSLTGPRKRRAAIFRRVEEDPLRLPAVPAPESSFDSTATAADGDASTLHVEMAVPRVAATSTTPHVPLIYDAAIASFKTMALNEDSNQRVTGIDDCIPTVTPVDSGTLLLGSSTACSVGGSTCIVPKTSIDAGKDDYVYDTYLLERYDLLDADATIDYMSAYVHDLTEVRGGRRAVGVLVWDELAQDMRVETFGGRGPNGDDAEDDDDCLEGEDVDSNAEDHWRAEYPDEDDPLVRDFLSGEDGSVTEDGDDYGSDSENEDVYW